MSKSTSALRHSKALGLSQKLTARSLFAKTNDKQATYDNVYSMSMTDTNDERCKAETNDDRCKPLTHVPGPSGIHSIPYFGFFKHFKPLGQYTSGTFHKFIKDLYIQYGDIVKHRVGLKQWKIFLFNPDDIRESLWQDEKYPHRDQSTIMTAYARRQNTSLGLAFQNGNEWEKSRKTVQEKLCPNAVANYTPVLLDIAEDVLNSRRQEFCISDTHHFLTRYTMKCTGLLCFGNTSLTNEKSADEVINAVFNFLDSFNKSYDTIPLFTLFRTPLYTQFEESYNIIKTEVQKYLNVNNKSQFKDGDIQAPLMCHMMQRSDMTSDQICTIITDLFITAVDSTANVLTFVLYQLAKNMECQEKLLKEIQNASVCVANDDTRPFQNLQYLKACVKESMRLVYPLRDGSRRTLDKNTTISRYLIPKGSVLVFGNNTICANEKYFPEADKFVPERWLRSIKDKEYIHPYALLPFGHGRRNCVGQRFAEHVMYSFILQIVKNYRMSLVADSEPVGYTYKLFSTPDRVFSLNLDPRKQSNSTAR